MEFVEGGGAFSGETKVGMKASSAPSLGLETKRLDEEPEATGGRSREGMTVLPRLRSGRAEVGGEELITSTIDMPVLSGSSNQNVDPALQ